MRNNTRVVFGKARVKTTRVTSRDGILRSPTFDDVTVTQAPLAVPEGDEPDVIIDEPDEDDEEI